MNPRTILTGLGAFGAGIAALLTAAVVGEAYIGHLPDVAPDGPAPEPPAPQATAPDGPALIEAPHVTEERDGPVDTAPGAPGVASSAPAVSTDNSPEHVPTDLMADATPGQARAPDAFRPDPTAPMPPEMRDSLRPATGHAPGFAADEGDTVTEPVSG